MDKNQDVGSASAAILPVNRVEVMKEEPSPSPQPEPAFTVGNRQTLWTIMQRAQFDEHMRLDHPEIPHVSINVSEAIQRLHRGTDSWLSPGEFAIWLAAVVKEYYDVKKQSRPEYAAWLAGLRLRGMRGAPETVDEAIRLVRRSILGPHLKQLKDELDASEALARQVTEHKVKELVEEGSQSKKQKTGDHPDEGASPDASQGGQSSMLSETPSPREYVTNSRSRATPRRRESTKATRAKQEPGSPGREPQPSAAAPDASQGGRLADDWVMPMTRSNRISRPMTEEQIQEHEKWLAAAIATNRNLQLKDEEEEAPTAGTAWNEETRAETEQQLMRMVRNAEPDAADMELEPAVSRATTELDRILEPDADAWTEHLADMNAGEIIERIKFFDAQDDSHPDTVDCSAGDSALSILASSAADSSHSTGAASSAAAVPQTESAAAVAAVPQTESAAAAAAGGPQSGNRQLQRHLTSESGSAARQLSQ